jgi:hypothetical protein
MSGFYYLASPYSKYPGGPDRACADVCLLAARMFMAGVSVFSPIAHTHAIAVAGDLAGHFEQWAAFDEAMIAASEGVIVAMMQGWRESSGIAAEIEIAQRLGKPVRYMDTSLNFVGGEPVPTTGYFAPKGGR